MSAVMFVASGCSKDVPSTMQDEGKRLQNEVEPGPSHPLTPFASPIPPMDEVSSESGNECLVGQILLPMDRCRYPGTSDYFSVDESGVGHFLFLSASSVIDARNAIINNQPYEFTARKGEDGNWTIEVAGGPLNSIRVSDIRVAATATASPTPSRTAEPFRSTEASPVPARVTYLHSPTPTVTPVRLPFSTPTGSGIPSPTSTPRTLAAERIETSATDLSLTAAPDSPEPLQVGSPSPSVSPVATTTPVASLRPEIEEEALGVAPLRGQSVRVRESSFLSIANLFPEITDDGTKRFRALVGNPVIVESSVDSLTGEVTLTGLKPGLTWISPQACNSLKCSKLGEKTIRVTVPQVQNRPPQAVEAIEDQKVHVGDSISLSIDSAFWDFEGDPIVNYHLRLGDAELVTEAAVTPIGLLTMRGEQVGTASVSVTACDNEGCGSVDSALRFVVNVLDRRNQPPSVVEKIADKNLHLGETIRLDLGSLFEDPEGDMIHDYTFERQDKGVVVGEIYPETGVLMVRGAEVGRTTASIHAYDSGSGERSAGLTFNLTVVEPPRSPPQVVGTVPDQTVALDDSAEVSVSHAFAASPRFRVIRYDVLLNQPEVGLDSDIDRAGILTLEGTETGRTWVSVRACSYAGCSNFSALSFVLTVTDSEEEQNASPAAVGAIQDRTMMVGDTATLDISKAFKDPENDRIVDYKYSLSKSGCASGSITDTGILTLHGSGACTTTVSVSACDDEDECSDPGEVSFTLTVGTPIAKQ